MKRAETVKEFLNNEGLLLEKLGGNTSAYMQSHTTKHEGNEYQESLQLQDLYLAPTRWADGPIEYSFECLSANDSDVDGRYVRVFPTVRHFSNWLDTAKHLLPWEGNGYEVNGWTWEAW